MMTTIKNIAYTLSLAGIISVAGGCNKFVDINTDPNNPTTAELSLLLPSTEVSMAANMYQLNSGTSTFMQHMVSTAALSRYQQSGNSFDDSWNGFYSQTLNDLETIIKTGTEEEQWGYVSIAKLEKAYLVSLMVDMWGDIPYSEAQQGQENVSPAFEKGAEIYPKLLVMIDEAIADAGKVTASRYDLWRS
jgi:hypothetical protein